MLAVPALLLSLTGCASVFSSYPAQADKWMVSYQNGQTEALLTQLTPKMSEQDGLLYSLEAGRFAQLGGQPDTSKQAFESAFLFLKRKMIRLASVPAVLSVAPAPCSPMTMPGPTPAAITSASLPIPIRP